MVSSNSQKSRRNGGSANMFAALADETPQELSINQDQSSGDTRSTGPSSTPGMSLTASARTAHPTRTVATRTAKVKFGTKGNTSGPSSTAKQGTAMAGNQSSFMSYDPAVERTVVTTFARNRGKNSDIQITGTDVICNEVQIDTTMRGDKPVFTKTIHLTPDVFNYVVELNQMDREQMAELMKGKYVQFDVDIASAESRAGDLPKNNVINTWYRIQETFPMFMENIIIRLPCPSPDCEVTRLQQYIQTSEQYEKSGTRESTFTRAYPFIAKLVKELKACTSLKHLDVIVGIPEPVENNINLVSTDLFDVALPFYELTTFPGWNLSWSSPKNRRGQWVPRQMRHTMKTKFDKIAAMDRSAIVNISRPTVGAAPTSQSLQEALAAAFAASAAPASTTKK